MTNKGNGTLNFHDLVDNQLGTLFTGLNYALTPGSSVNTVAAGLNIPAVINATTVNTATWTAYNPDYVDLVTATDTATVTVTELGPAIDLVKTVGTTPGVCAATDNIVVTAGTPVYYCYQVENTGDVTFNFHDLVDSELGTLLNDFPYTLAPGAFSPQVIIPDTPMATVTNVGTWTALTALGTYAYDDQAPFNYIPINTTGTPLGLADDGEANITSPFPFTFYGVTSSNLRVGNNGGILFNATTGDVGITNAALPIATPPLSILPFWDDIDSDTGDVYWEVQGTAPNRMLIVEWYNRPHYSNTGSATFEVILYETSNEIKYQYLDVDFGNASYNFGASATVGINKNATTALQYSFNQPVITDGKAIRFYEVVPVSASATDVATVTVQTPNIDVSPLSLSETHLSPPQVTTQPLTIANTGQGARANAAGGTAEHLACAGRGALRQRPASHPSRRRRGRRQCQRSADRRRPQYLRLRPPGLGRQPGGRRLHCHRRRLADQHDHLLRLPDGVDDDLDLHRAEPAHLGRAPQRPDQHGGLRRHYDQPPGVVDLDQHLPLDRHQLA